MGETQDGHAFEEQTMLRGMSLHGGTIYLDHAPKLQSALQVVLENPAGEGKKQLALQGYVVHVEPNAGKRQVGVGIVFTE